MLNPNRRRYLQFSLASLLIAVTFIGIALGPVVNRIRHQKRVVESITKIGGQVHFADESKGPNGRPSRPSWLRTWVGDDYFRTVSRINLQGCPATDDLVADISRLDKLDELNLIQTKITDKSLPQIARLRSLKALSLGFNDITNEGLGHLAPLDQLAYLDLCVTNVTDDGLIALLELPKLDRLELFATPITDSGAATLSKMSSLSELDVADTFITNDGVEYLARLPNLTSLRLDQMSAGFGRELRINDTGLEHVGRMSKLREVFLRQLGVSDEGLKTLKQKCPALIVTR